MKIKTSPHNISSRWTSLLWYLTTIKWSPKIYKHFWKTIFGVWKIFNLEIAKKLSHLCYANTNENLVLDASTGSVHFRGWPAEISAKYLWKYWRHKFDQQRSEWHPLCDSETGLVILTNWNFETIFFNVWNWFVLKENLM